MMLLCLCCFGAGMLAGGSIVSHWAQRAVRRAFDLGVAAEMESRAPRRPKNSEDFGQH